MLYELNGETEIKKMEFMNFSDQDKLEKDLENLLAENLTDTLFETPLYNFLSCSIPE